MCSGPGLHADFSLLCELCLEQDFLPKQFCCNSLLHRRGHWAKSSIPSYELNTSLCPSKGWSDQASAELAPGMWAWALLWLCALLSSVNSNHCTHKVLPRGRSHNSWKVPVKQVEFASFLIWDRARICLRFRHLDHLSQEPSLAHEKDTQQLCSWLIRSRLRFTLIKISKMSSFHKLTQIRLFAGASEPSPILWACSLGFERSRHIRMSTPEDKKQE